MTDTIVLTTYELSTGLSFLEATGKPSQAIGLPRVAEDTELMRSSVASMTARGIVTLEAGEAVVIDEYLAVLRGVAEASRVITLAVRDQDALRAYRYLSGPDSLLLMRTLAPDVIALTALDRTVALQDHVVAAIVGVLEPGTDTTVVLGAEGHEGWLDAPVIVVTSSQAGDGWVVSGSELDTLTVRSGELRDAVRSAVSAVS